jgi:hypothetical protein
MNNHNGDSTGTPPAGDPSTGVPSSNNRTHSPATRQAISASADTTGTRRWPREITHDEMAALVNAGRAEQWPPPDTADVPAVPAVARLDGHWYAIAENSEIYQSASPALAQELTELANRWHLANTMLTSSRAASPASPLDDHT